MVPEVGMLKINRGTVGYFQKNASGQANAYLHIIQRWIKSQTVLEFTVR